MHVRKADGSYGAVESVTTETSPREMYNLTVDAAHTYFVGNGQWLVQNICDSSTLSRNLGGGVGDNMQAHHLIPCEYEFHPFVNRASAAGWDMNQSYNGVLLPDNLKLSNQVDLPVHNGYHADYSSDVVIRLDKLESLASENNWNNQTALNQLKILAKALNTQITNMGGGQFLR